MAKTCLWSQCPLCDRTLDGQVFYIGSAACPLGHYTYEGMGSYASQVTLKVGDKEEGFYLDDMFSDYEKLLARLNAIRAADKKELFTE